MSGRFVAMSGIFLVCFATVGCSGGSDPNRQPTQPVAVTVTYEGSPVEDATVTFISTGDDPVPAVGRTDAQGVAKMKTYEEEDGALLGTHKVIITKREITNAPPSTADTESQDYQPPSPGGSPVPVTKNLIPRKYGSPATSGLTADVTEGDPIELTFNLEG